MRKIIILTILFIVFIGYNNLYYELSDLSSTKIKFEQLPEEVKDVYLNTSKYRSKESEYIFFISLDNPNIYNYEVIEMMIGPWIAYHKLSNKQKNISYRIARNAPDPKIVFENKIYLPVEYNTLSNIKPDTNLEFNCYVLK